MNFIQTFCILDGIFKINRNNIGSNKTENMITQIFEWASGFFSSILSLDCLMQGIFYIIIIN